MPPEPIRTVIDHPAPMAIRWGRGNAIGIFAVDARTDVEIPGVEPEALAPPRNPIFGCPTSMRVHDGRLWKPVTTTDRTGARPVRPSSGQSLSWLSATRRERSRLDTGFRADLERPPFADALDWSFHTARAMRDAGQVPRSAAGLVDEARAAASRAVAAHAAADLLHDGRHLYVRLPFPLLSSRLSQVRLRPDLDVHDPDFLHTRLALREEIPFVAARAKPSLEALAAAVASGLPDVDPGNEDVVRFANHAPSMLMGILFRAGGEEALAFRDRLWPLLVATARGGIPGDGLETALRTVRAGTVLALQSGKTVFNPRRAAGTERRSLEAWVAFIDEVGLPSLSAPARPDDDAELASLAPR